MWERIGDSSVLVIGAVVLFALFALMLFIMERDEFKKRRRRKKTMYLVPEQNSSARKQSSRQRALRRAENTVYNDKKLRKIS